MNPSPRIRLTARILVLNERDEVLTLEAYDVNNTPTDFWETPGGDLEPDESFEDAAKRELLEETGLVVQRLGSHVWVRRKTVPAWGISRMLPSVDEIVIEERYFVVRVDGFAIRFENPDELERNMTLGHCWWSLEELISTSETVYPENLARHLKPILRGEMPTEPVDISLEIAS